MQGHISGIYVRLLFEWLNDKGFEAEKVLQRSCPDLDERIRVPFDEWRAMLERTYQVTQDPYLRDNLTQDLKNCRKHLEEVIRSSPALDLSQPSEEGWGLLH